MANGYKNSAEKKLKKLLDLELVENNEIHGTHDETHSHQYFFIQTNIIPHCPQHHYMDSF